MAAAAERKARAEQIRARNEKMLKAIADKKSAAEKQEREKEEQAKRLKEIARQQVKQ